MHFIPLALGLVAIFIGVAMVAFGIPNNEFGIGNTLIAAGTTAIVGGFVLLGLWAAVLQLQRMVGTFEPRAPRPAARRGATATLDAERGHPAQAESAFQPRLAPEDAPEREPAAAASHEPADRGWPGSERESDLRSRERAAGEERAASREEESSWELFAPSRPSSPTRERSFDAIWPSERPREGRPPPLPQPGDRARAEGPEPQQGPAGAGQSATILKSGVINGMAYTLYTDGSIEAELPQGTLRFGSLDELRDYLASHP